MKGFNQRDWSPFYLHSAILYCAKAKRQQHGFICAKAKRQQQGFICAKAKRQQHGVLSVRKRSDSNTVFYLCESEATATWF